ncbi:hypothetical protein Q7P37_011549 [Cladosporium fusiforme]
MPWPPWPFRQSSAPEKKENDTINTITSALPAQLPEAVNSWTSSLNARDATHYTSTQTIFFCAVTSATTLVLFTAYKTYLRRIPGADYLKPSFFRRRSLYGHVTSVGDGDNFRFFHTPGGRLLGWGWLRRIGQNKKNKNGKRRVGGTEGTLHVRIAGVDAPEMAHFGRPSQPYSQEALDWLRSFLLQKRVRVYPYRRDQYDRVVCSVVRRRWFFFKQDVGLAMIKRGLATVYEAKFGSEFGGNEEAYREAETKAKAKKVGMWQEAGLVSKMLGKTNQPLESPREYKTRMAKEEGNGSAEQKGKS